MPFKTKAKKEQASQRWATFIEGGQASYGKEDGLKVLARKDEVEIVKRPQTKITEQTYTKAEIVKIALMAFLIIGLQIILRISRIGF